SGNLKSLIGYDEAELDATGNIELRCWACAAGALGERVPDVVQLDPSWHHNYATLGWWRDTVPAVAPHYPATRPELVALTGALHGLAHDAAARRAYLADPAGYAGRFDLDDAQRLALEQLDRAAFATMGVHPLVPFLAAMQLDRDRR